MARLNSVQKRSQIRLLVLCHVWHRCPCSYCVLLPLVVKASACSDIRLLLWLTCQASNSLCSLRRLLDTANVVPSSPILVTLMMEALRCSETSVLTRATWRNIPEDGIRPNMNIATFTEAGKGDWFNSINCHTHQNRTYPSLWIRIYFTFTSAHCSVPLLFWTRAYPWHIFRLLPSLLEYRDTSHSSRPVHRSARECSST
jgi:hypothetical protein